MPEYRDKQVIETYRKGSPARNMGLMSPLDRKGEVYAQRRRTSHDQYLAPRRRSPAYYNDDDYDDYADSYDRHVGRSRSPNTSRRHGRHRRDDRLVRRDRYDSSSSESDSSASSSSRRRKPKLRPCSSVCRDHPQPPKEDDSDPYDSTAERIERAKRRKSALLTAGLAAVSTVAAGNGIYQNTKAYHARKNAMRDGEMCSHEAEKLKTKATLMNIFSLGVVAVGLNNVRIGWMRHENTRQANKEAERKAWEKKARREDRERRDDRYR